MMALEAPDPTLHIAHALNKTVAILKLQDRGVLGRSCQPSP